MAKNPWIFIPPLYFSEGLIYIIVNSLSVIMYKRLGVSNTEIGITSLFYLPWVIKMVWSPFVAGNATKRKWIIFTQIVIGCLLLATAFSLKLDSFLGLTLTFFVMAALFSATHDIAADGYYMVALTTGQQSFFVGIRSLFYRLAMIFGSGTLVFIAGKWEDSTGDVASSWSRVLILSSMIYLFMSVYNLLLLPKHSADVPELSQESKNGGQSPFIAAFKIYFSREGVIPLILFVILFRFGEALLLKMVAPFLLDGASAGGLALSTKQVGIVYGTVGVVSLIFGGITGGALISKLGLQRTIWPFALSMNVPSMFYIYLALAKPELPFVYGMIAIEQFCYGLGMTALTVVLISSSKGESKTSNFAISTGIMALGMMLPGLVSGYLQQNLGYPTFFTVAVLLSVPGMILIKFLPKTVYQK
jgi:PAT family beta-lactamase induction signal transducer AmpG